MSEICSLITLRGKPWLLRNNFNDWDKSSTVMKKLKNGSFSASLDLPVEKDYQFRYLLDGKAYENDWQADAYTVSPMSNEENSVIKL